MVEYQGRSWSFIHLCRVHEIARQTVDSRLAAGMSLHEALTTPSSYPERRKTLPGTQVDPVVHHPMMRSAIDVLIAAREVATCTETPRRRELLQKIDAWLHRAGRPQTAD